MMIKTNELSFQFNIVGGYEKGFGIFISKVEPGSKVDYLITIFALHKYLRSFHSDVMEKSKILPSSSQAEEIGLKKGDQILEVNTQTRLFLSSSISRPGERAEF